MIDNPQITVVIPCFNAEKHLAKTLKALQDQCYTDWCAVIIDDGSSDQTLEIAESFCSDSRFAIIRQSNSGVSVARNKGVSLAATPFIAFLDADDVWHQQYLSRMLSFIEQDRSREIVFARARIVDEEGVATGATSKSKLSGLSTFDLLCSNPTTTCSNLFVRSGAFGHAGQFKTDLNHAEDQLWLLEAHLAGCKIEGLDEVLLDYRTNTSGLSSDLEAMRKGWETLCHEATTRHPEITKSLTSQARALNLRYLARRSLRLAPGSGKAGNYFYNSLQSNWKQMITDPWPVWPLTAVCLLDAIASPCCGHFSSRKGI